MFKWLDIREFMNTSDEWHAFVEGVNETFCFWKERVPASPELFQAIQHEHHYYTTGRVVGFIGLVFFAWWIYRLVRRFRSNGVQKT